MRTIHWYLGLTALLAVTPSALAVVVVKGSIDNRNGMISAWDGNSGNDPAEFSFNIDPSEKFDPKNINQTVQLNNRVATLVHDSMWFGANPGSSTTGFMVDETYTVMKPSGAGYAKGIVGQSQMSIDVSGLVGGETIPFDFMGDITENLGDGSVSIVGPGVNQTFNTTTTWNQLLSLTNGTYTVTVTVNVVADTSPAATKSVDLSYKLVQHITPTQCNATAGSCFWIHPGPGCNDTACCDTVCSADPTCCSAEWDVDCVTSAEANCDQAEASGIVIDPANGHRYQLVTPGTWEETRAFSASSTFANAFGCPVTINNGFENQWIRCYLADNVPGVATPDNLFISAYYEGTNANNHAIQIFNGTGASVNLAAGAYTLIVYSNGSASGTSFSLSGTIPSGATWVVAPSDANANLLSETDQQLGTSFDFDGNDAIALRKGATTIDVFGQIGFNPGIEWGRGTSGTQDNVLIRNASICTGDANGADAFDPSIEWTSVGCCVPANLGTPHIADCFGSFDVWTGYTDEVSEGNFVWWCAQTPGYTNWLPGEPNNGGNQDWVMLEANNGQWNTRGAAAITYGVTEFEFVSCGNGLSCFTVHASPACNDESCCNTVCFVDSTCCFNSWDTDCVAIANGLCGPGVLAGPIVNPANSHKYYLIDRGAWSEAQKMAQSLGGTLVVINDAAENAWVRTNVAQFGGDLTRNCFIGLTDQLSEGTFQWIDASPVTYTNWNAGEPNNSGLGVGQDYGTLLTSGLWDDDDNTGFIGYTTFAIAEVGCVGDIDGNGTVDASDLAIVLGAWNTTDKDADLNHDGTVNASDLALVLGGWGPC